MADPVKTIRSLETLSSEYSVFERDQVLTEAQLNSVARYFDDQERLTRVELLGVGLIGGLRVSLTSGKIRVGKGLGLTTDGDLLLLPADTAYDSIKAYDEKAPFYAPFYSGTDDAQVMLKLWELVKEGESDVAKQPLNTLPGALTDYVVVMYMESYEQDHDLCSAADCDNLGIVTTHMPRMLLVSRNDAATLLTVLPTIGSAALELPVLSAQRPKLSVALDSTGKLAALYRAACNGIHASLIASLPALDGKLPGLLAEAFASDPVGGWIGKLNAFNGVFASRDAGIQYYYAFLKDLVETWNDLREQLLDDDSVFCPELGAFPKHLLLGDFSVPPQMRTGLYPSPLTSDARTPRAHARFLLRKLDTLLNAASFPLPAAMPIRITPSKSEGSPLEERAIPFYYAHKSDFPVLPAWSYRLTARKGAQRNQGYRWAEYTGTAAPDLFATQIGRHDFFRIEGHLGQKVDSVSATLKAAIASANLPLAVRTALLHNDRKKIVIRPPRYGDLHRFHYLVRKEVTAQLDFGKRFNQAFKNKIDAAAGKDIPDVIKGDKVVDTAKTAYDKINTAIDKASAPLGVKKYSSYRQTLSDTSGNWKASYKEAISTAGGFKVSFGDVVRTDFSSPFDSMMTSNHSAWLDWLDIIIDRRDEREDKRLLLSGFIQEHPGIEHSGGVARGGTFVLVYDDNANVVADFCLPYYVQEHSEDEPDDEPDLVLPDYRLPDIFDKGYRIMEPIDTRFTKELNAFEAKIRPQWMEEINIQKNYSKFFQESLGSLGDVLGKFGADARAGVNVLPNTNDAYLNSLLEDIQAKTNQIDKMRDQLAKGDMPDEIASKMKDQLDRYQQDLGNTVKETTRHMVETKTDVAAGQPAADALQVIGGAIVTIKDEKTLKSIASDFKGISAGAPAAQQNIVNGVMNAGGMRFG
ncbi:MAG: hypothetical protein IPI21_14495 [Propionivibrio sp.]|nr:hypothetical protein [Propionivibrio sp.]